MKKFNKSVLVVLPLILVALLAAAFISPSSHTSGKASITVVAKSDTLPADINAFVQNSCTACHADGGKALAMSKLNFSEWNSYDHDKKVKKAGAMAKILEKGSMPPKSFLKSHPEAAPTQAQVDLVKNWSKELSKE
ncbi:MAG TPA: heme-binding domain-containing protein [Bacteroidales bacterium]|nr:heme-binding domain-containing protein [Bacteroidales bacterium]